MSQSCAHFASFAQRVSCAPSRLGIRNLRTLACILAATTLVACGKAPAPAAPKPVPPPAAAPAAAPAGGNLAVNGDFEQALTSEGMIPGWVKLQHGGDVSYEMAVEPAAAYSGKNGFRMTRTLEQVYGTLAQDITLPQPMSGEVELSAMLKTKDVGPAGWMLMIIADAPPVYSQPLIGTTQWQKVTVRAPLKPNTTTFRIGVTLLDAGTGWADDIQVKAVAP